MRRRALLRVVVAAAALLVLLAGMVGILAAMVEALGTAPGAATQAALAALLGLPSVVLGALIGGELEEAVRELLGIEEDER